MADQTIIACHTGLDLTSSPIDPSWILDGTPLARNRVISHSSDKAAWTMLWDCTQGAFRWTYQFDETVHVLDGSVAITDANGHTRVFAAGDVIFFPAGSVAEWRIDSYVRKLAFCQNPVPLPLNIVWRLIRRAARVIGEFIPIFRRTMAVEGPARDIALSGSFSTPSAV